MLILKEFVILSIFSNSQQPALVYFVDAQKAFDCVEWRFLLAVLSQMSWGQHLLAWVRMIYVEQWAVVSLLGAHSRSITIKCGIRQGCPLSTLLFNIPIEMLAIVVRSCSGIKGIQLFSISHKVSLYADDAVFFLSNPVKSMTFLQQWLERFF